MVRVLKKGTKIDPKWHREFNQNGVEIFVDFLMILGGLRASFWDHFGIKIASKNQSKNRSDFEWILEGFWLPKLLHFGSILAPKID